MTRIFFVVFILLNSMCFFAQNSEEYQNFVKQAMDFYEKKEYLKSAEYFSNAFRSNGWKGLAEDRYGAACSWALAGNKDSSFFQLFRIAQKANFSDYYRVTTDSDLVSLYKDKRWNELLVIIKKNKEKEEENYNKPLVASLDSIYNEDQSYRLQLEAVREKYGWESKEIKDLWKIIRFKDSINLLKVKNILDKDGWLGPNIIGERGNSTLFLVVQHSDQKTQEKYLPMMREAVKKGNAYAGSLALLEDRVALGQGKKQIYGSQIGMDNETKTYYVLPLEDPDNVDKRRAEVDLQPLAEYVKHWQIKWDVEEYKKQLAAMEKKNKK